jgi:hypothetical protein
MNNTIDQLVSGVLRHGPDILGHCVCTADISKYVNYISDERLDYPIPPTATNPLNWFIPTKYKNIEIEHWCLLKCNTDDEIARVTAELVEYKSRDLYPVLQCMIYIVDTLRSNGIVWGVGRGSSVSSYVLFLIGVHKIDSIKYGLSVNEFLR